MAVIEASAAGGKWTEAAAWVGGVEPKAGDDVILAAASGSIATTLSCACRSIDATNYKKELKIESPIKIGTATSNGGLCLKLGAGMTIGSGLTIEFVSTSGSVEQITCAGIVLGSIRFQTGKYELVDKLATRELVGENPIKLVKAELKTNNQEISAQRFEVQSEATLICGSSTIKNFTNAGGPCLTIQAGATVSIGTSNFEFVGKEEVEVGISVPTGFAFSTLTIAKGKIKLGEGFSCTIAKLILNTAGKGFVKFIASQTVTITESLTTNGKAGSLVTIESAGAAKAKIKLSTAGTTLIEFMTIKGIALEGPGIWTTNGTDANRGGNTGIFWPNEEQPYPIKMPPSWQTPRGRYKQFPISEPLPAPPVAHEQTLTIGQGQATTKRSEVVRALRTTQAQVAIKSVVPNDILATTQVVSSALGKAITRTLTHGQGQSVVRINVSVRLRTLGVTQGQALNKAVHLSRAVSTSQPQAIVRTTSIGRRLTTAQEQTATRTQVHAFTQALTIGQAQGASAHASRSAHLRVAQGQTQGIARSLLRTQTISQAVAVSFASSFATSFTLIAAQGSAASCERSTGRSISATATATQDATVTVSVPIDRTLRIGQGQNATIHVSTFNPAKLDSSLSWQGIASSVEAATLDASSVAPDLLIESTVD
jgi:hypothetical protein